MSVVTITLATPVTPVIPVQAPLGNEGDPVFTFSIQNLLVHFPQDAAYFTDPTNPRVVSLTDPLHPYRGGQICTTEAVGGAWLWNAITEPQGGGQGVPEPQAGWVLFVALLIVVVWRRI